MRKSLIMIPVLAAIAACGSSGEQGPTLARINGESFTEGDLDLRLSAMDDSRREEVLRDPELRRREFENILRARLYSLAGQKSTYGDVKSLKRRLGLIDQRVVTQYYFENYLNVNGGHTGAEIEAYYKANLSRFPGDSGKTAPLARVQAQVVDSLILQEANLDSFYTANSVTYLRPARVDVSMIQTATRKQADAALKALKGGKSFGEIAGKFSIHPSKDKQGSMGTLMQGEYQYEIAAATVTDSLFFGPQRLKPGQYSGVLATEGKFIIAALTSYEPQYQPPLKEIRAQVAAEYVREFRSARGQNAVADLKKKREVRLITSNNAPTEKEIQAYYDSHKDMYETAESFELYHIEAANEAKLKKAVANVKTLDQFKAAVAGVSENALTKEQGGYLGPVKRDFSLPYGIGTMPSLFSALDEIDNGKLPELVQNPSTQTWNAFWLVKKNPRQQKPLDRVHDLVREDVKANRILKVNPNDSLAVIGSSGTLITEEDVIFLRGEIPEQMQERYTRENLVDYLLVWRLASEEAASLGLDKERKLRALRLQTEDTYWERLYQDSVLSKTWNEDPALLAKTFKAERNLFNLDSSATWKTNARDVAAFLRLTQKDFEIEYRTNPDRYMKDSTLQSITEARASIFQSLKPVAYARLDARVLASLKTRFKVTLVDPTLKEPSLEPVGATYKKAQDLHYDRKLDQALALYEKLRETYPNKAGLQDSVSFGVAQIYIEQERYPQAMAEYRRVSYLYPNSANDYKAMFMVGFIYAEHLKNDSAAVRAFEAMIAKYPKSDLSDDADWMIRNIRSGGKLMPVLEDEPAKQEEPAVK